MNLKKLTINIFLVLLMCSFRAEANSEGLDDSDGGYASIGDFIETYDQMIADCMRKYLNKNNFTITNVYEKYASVENMSQANLNDQYNLNHVMYNPTDGYLIEYSGTCSEVAVTMANKFYANNQYTSGNATNYSVFEECIEYAVDNEYFPTRSERIIGDEMIYYEETNTKFLKCKEIFENSLTQMGVNYETWINNTNIVQGIRDFTNDHRGAKPQILGIDGHVLLAVGYVDIEYSYTVDINVFNHNYTYTFNGTQTYIAVCDGFSDKSANQNSSRADKDACYSYISALKDFKYVIGIEIL